jgi:hypothetical protein
MFTQPSRNRFPQCCTISVSIHQRLWIFPSYNSHSTRVYCSRTFLSHGTDCCLKKALPRVPTEVGLLSQAQGTRFRAARGPFARRTAGQRHPRLYRCRVCVAPRRQSLMGTMLFGLPADWAHVWAWIQEDVEYRSDGTKTVLRPTRMSLARVSVLRGQGPKTGIPFIDDYINTTEPIADYVTEFSGIRRMFLGVSHLSPVGLFAEIIGLKPAISMRTSHDTRWSRSKSLTKSSDCLSTWAACLSATDLPRTFESSVRILSPL